MDTMKFVMDWVQYGDLVEELEARTAEKERRVAEIVERLEANGVDVTDLRRAIG